jgi:hypothetical protein
MLNSSQKQNFINGFVGSFVVQGILYVGNVNSGDLYNMLHLSFLIAVSMFFFGHEDEVGPNVDTVTEVTEETEESETPSEEAESERKEESESEGEVVKKPIFVWRNDTVNHM